MPASPSVSVALYEPEIPGNAGSVARLCAATGSPLHLIGRLGFSFEHPKAKRAVMDYWSGVEMHRHVNYADFAASCAGRTVWAFSTRAERDHWDAEFSPDDVLLFGPESRGLPSSLLAAAGVHALRIPMLPTARSLNLSTSVSAALFEALRQLRWRPGQE
jgi:tRNA (cytidine/uridine-2'-O-)-methyltransferase